MKLAIPVILIVLGLAGLIFMGIVQGGVPELQVTDVLEGAAPDREVKVHGRLARIDSSLRPLRFAVADKEHPGKTIEVICDATRPDTFQLTYDVAVQGRYDADKGVFRADKVFTKCPSKYEAEDKLRSPDQYAPESGPKPPLEDARAPAGEDEVR